MIKGDKSILYIDFGSGFVPVACLTSHSFSESSETLPTTTVENGGWDTSIATNQSYNISLSGLTKSDATDASIVSYYKLLSLKRARTVFDWEIRSFDEENREYVDYGKGFINDIGNEAPAGDFVTFTASITGYGKPYYSTPLSGNTWDSTIITFDSTEVTFDQT